jgi:hypothetical protein
MIPRVRRLQKMYSCVAVSEYLLTNQLWFNTYTMPETDPAHEDDKGLARKSWADSFLQPEKKKRTSWADHFLRPGMDLESVSFFILGTHANDKSCSPHVLVCVIDYDDVCAGKILPFPFQLLNDFHGNYRTLLSWLHYKATCQWRVPKKISG